MDTHTSNGSPLKAISLKTLSLKALSLKAISLSALSALSLGLTLSACADTGIEGGEVAKDKLLNARTTYTRSEIGRLLTSNGGLCTATLIRSNVLISAAHCIQYGTGVQRWGSFQIDSGSAFPINGAISFSDEAGELDIVLLELEGAVPGVLATPTYIEQGVPPNGTPVTIYGYGCDERDSETGSGVKRLFSFRAGEDSFNLCPGDSGGPVVSGEDGGVVWINSAYYTQSGNDIYGQAAVYSQELNQIADVISSQGTAAALRALGVSGQGSGNSSGNTSGSSSGGGSGGGSSGGSSAGPAIYSCSELWSCALQCGGNSTCAQSCVDRTQDPSATSAALALSNCSSRNNCLDEACLASSCGYELQVCGVMVSVSQGGGGEGGSSAGGSSAGWSGSGYDNCEAVYGCIGSCATEECVNACYSYGTAQAQSAISALISCYQTNSCENFTDYLCMQSECPSQFASCFGY